MRIFFVSTGAEQIGVEMLSAMARQAGHRVALAHSPVYLGDRGFLNPPLIKHFFHREGRLVDDVVAREPDVVCFSPVTATYSWMSGIAQKIKERIPHVKILFGGSHASAVPHKLIAQPHIDAVCIGEGEYAFLKYLSYLENGQPSGTIPNFWIKTSDDKPIERGLVAPFIPDLDALPFPDKRLFEDAWNMRDMYNIMIGRGCPNRCSYCFNSYWSKLPHKRQGPYVRFRSVDHVMAELELGKKRYDFRFVEFSDDVFTFRKEWTLEFLDKYKKNIRVPFSCISHLNYIDEDIAVALREAGCEQIEVGIQTTNDEIRHDVLSRNESTLQEEAALEILQKQGIAFRPDHLMGVPGETAESHQEAFELYSRFSSDRVSTFWLQYYPGTELLRKSVEQGILAPDEVEQIENGEVINYYRPDKDKVDDLRMLLYYEFLIKWLPLFGKKTQKYTPRWLFKVAPPKILSTINFVSDIFVSLAKRNSDISHFGKFYLKHMLRSLLPSAGQTTGAYLHGVPLTLQSLHSQHQFGSDTDQSGRPD